MKCKIDLTSEEGTLQPFLPLIPPLIAKASLKPFFTNNSATLIELPSKLPYNQRKHIKVKETKQSKGK